MAAERTKLKTYRLKESTIEAINEMALMAERKHNWVVQKILDMYIQKKMQNKSNESQK